MSLPKNFENKVVLVTGSSSGIGEATALLFAKLGAKVVVNGRNPQTIANVSEKCQQISPKKLKPLQIVADVMKEEDNDRLIDETVAHFGQLDVLVNNAGVGGGNDHETLEEFDKFMQTNLRSVYQLCWRAMPHLQKTKGSIVNNSSICSLKPYPHSVSYCVAKAGLDMLTRWLGANWGPKGIRVNGVNPGQIDTNIWQGDTKMDPKEMEIMWKAVEQKYPLRRRGYPEDIAKAIVFLASDDSSFITGVNIKIDGGFMDSGAIVWD